MAKGNIVPKISVNVTTKSNLFIGGSPATFEIGGVDLFTVTNANGLPYIPGSSLKGVMRHMVRELISSNPSEQPNDELRVLAKEINQWYKGYLQKVALAQEEQLTLLNIENERKERAVSRMQDVIDRASAEYLFGIENFNDTPKLLFNDLLVDSAESAVDRDTLFSIDTKNKIEDVKLKDRENVAANPRTYQVVRPGVTFVGDIILYRFELLGDSGIQQKIIEFMERLLLQFNEGIYRLGNSGSRGYGRVQVDIMKEEV
ncbi:type III-B CRISPR module RAMP protein Cmr6 [Paenibacillus sp. FSL K6-2441]|uniref:type III-B CRISPR module RAMP protein Cmr6 n=1 Tax=Paenibacillus TaxID=44249 RepID=UPI0030DAC087